MHNIPKPPKFLCSFEGDREFITHTGIPIIIYEKIGDELISVVCEKADFTHPNHYSIAQSLTNIAREAAEFYEEYKRRYSKNTAKISSPYGANKTAILTVTVDSALLVYIDFLQEWQYVRLKKFCPEYNLVNNRIELTGEFIFSTGELNTDGIYIELSKTISFRVENDDTIHLLVNPALIARYDPEVGGRLSSECIITTNE